jgi:hypothetical protein
MKTIEILKFVQEGHKLRTGCSFYYYLGAAPAAAPNQLSMMGLGGGYRYTIDHVLGNTMTIYQKVAGNPLEVSVLVGCGGDITFDERRGVAYHPVVDQTPILTIH